MTATIVHLADRRAGANPVAVAIADLAKEFWARSLDLRVRGAEEEAARQRCLALAAEALAIRCAREARRSCL